MLSISKIQASSYYERKVIDGRKDYRSEARPAPGQWVGALAAAEGFTGPAGREDLAAFSGQHPNGGRLISHRSAVSGARIRLVTVCF